MKKKILFIIWSFTAGGGAEKILANIVNTLDQEKYEITILEFSNFNIRIEEVKDNIKILKPILINSGKEKGTLKEKINSKITYSLARKYPEIIRKLFIKENYDIEIAFNYLIPSFLVATKVNGKKLCWVHSSIENLDYNLKNNNEKNIKMKNKKQLKAFLKMDKIIAISKKTEESIIKLYPELKQKIERIYNGYDFEDIIKKSEEQCNLRIENEILLIGIGRLVKQKRFLLLIEVANELRNLALNFKIVIIGEGEQKLMLENKIKQYKLDEYVKLVGYLNNPYPYLKQADLFCLTSEAEGFPTVVVESMALGIPFISTEVAGVEELSNNNECGIVVEAKPKEIAYEIFKLIKDKERRNVMSRKCIKEVEKYSLIMQKEKIEKILDY